MDQEYFARMAAHGIVPRLLPRFLAAYRRHDATKTRRDAARGAIESQHVASRYAPDQRPRRIGLQESALRFFWHKATVLIPPYPRGMDVHQLYRASRLQGSAARDGSIPAGRVADPVR